MHGGEHQVARLGHGEDGVDRLQVAHLADHEDVGVLPEGGAQAPGKGVGVGAHLALVDGPEAVPMHVLDGVLDGEDVAAPPAVDVVDHGRQRGGLARPGRARHQDQPRRRLDHALDDGGKAEVLQRGDLGRDHPQGQARRTPLEEDVAAHPGMLLPGKGEVEFVLPVEDGEVLVAEQAVDQLLGVGRAQDVLAGHREQLAVDPHQRGRVHGQQEVGTPTLPEVGEQPLNPLGIQGTGMGVVRHALKVTIYGFVHIVTID